MACPYFDPAERLTGSGGSLGDLYAGLCRADTERSRQPDEQTVANRCNLGYARGCCAHFPQDGGPDAVRFSVKLDDGAAIRILYTFERDHRPFSNGALEYSAQTGELAGAADLALSRLATAYVRSYLRRTR
jgi:hypothetical protein